MISLSACTGPEGPIGPTGPTGPAGPGDQITYIFDITPSATTGLYQTASIPNLVTDSINEDFTTVVCYVRFSDGLGTYDVDSQALPYSDPVTQEDIFFTIQDGKVNLGWASLPNLNPFELIVTMVNPY